jgi:protoporphyrin/coproporphyrin ferrochelatase
LSKAVVLMAYGTPATIADVEAYYTHIRGGRKPSPGQLADLVQRYERIGGTSPLIRITEAQRAGLQERLAKAGKDVRVYAAMKHSPPFVGDVVERASREGATEILGIALAPHYSTMSVGSYQRQLEEGSAKASGHPRVEMVKSWHENSHLVSAWAERVKREAVGIGGEYSLVFSAHSLPARILEAGDPYRDQLLRTSELVAKEAGKKEWSFAFQSASHTGEPWLGPDILEHLGRLHDGGAERFVLAPVGFVSDHLEILYDIDVECKEWAAATGIGLRRCPSLNDSPELVDALASVVRERGFA